MTKKSKEDEEALEELNSAHRRSQSNCELIQTSYITTVFVDTRLWKTKHSRKRFQNFRQSCVLLADQIEIHQSQPDSMT